MKKEQFSRFYDMETRWYDEDMLGHINHGTAVAYFEDARVRHAHDIGLFPYDTDKFPFIVASMTFNFLKQIKHPKNLTVGLKISRIGGKSFDYEYGLFMENDEECAISCNMTMVCFDFSNQKSVQVFDEIKKRVSGGMKMNISVENDIKIIEMGEKGPNLLSVERAKKLIKELNYSDCKAVIILGNEKVFSAGLNLKDLSNAKEPNEVALIFNTLGELLRACRDFPGPVISIVGGHAIAGGCLLALASDYRYGMHGMHRMGLNEMAIGIDLPPDMLSIISHSISRDNLFEVATQCKMYTPKEALNKGLINEMVGNRFSGKKKAKSQALIKAKKLAEFYISAGEPFVRLKQSLMREIDFDYQILIDNWFSPSTQAKVKSVMSSLNKKMKIIIAGGTGFLGKKIVSSLADKGHSVCVLTRNLQKHKNTFSNNVNVIDWSTINPSQLSDTNILIKLNGEKVDQLWTKSVKSKILNSRIDSTRMLFDFCVKNEIIPQKFINASAVGIYAKESANYNFSVDENSELGNTFLAKVCVENERNSDIFKVFEDIDIIQLRIGVVLQKKIINLLSLNLLLSLPVPGNKNHYFPWVHADDIVGFINHSLDNNLIGAFNLVGSELTTHDTFFKSILKHKKSIISWVIFLPKFLIKFIFGNMSEMFLYGPKTNPARTLESNYQFKYSSLQEALLKLSE